MKPIELKNVPAGEFIKRKPDAHKVYKRADFDRSEKKYWLDDCDDISRGLLLKGSTIVYVDFEY